MHGSAPGTGSWKAWLDGYGTTHYDRLQVQVVSGGTTTTLGTFSNLDKGTSYVQRSFDLSAFTGRAVTLRFTGTEDSSLATGFVIDDASLTTG